MNVSPIKNARIVVRVFLLLAAHVIFLGCSNPMAGSSEVTSIDFNYSPGSPSTTPSSSNSGFKITPGGIKGSGTTIGARATVLIEGRKITGTTIAARISLNKGRPR